MFSKYKPKQRILADISMTPMIDIVFQLLTFFMITSTFIQTASLNVDLPKAVASDSSFSQENIITIYKNGRLEWNNIRISKAKLANKLDDIKKNNPNTSLVIQGDEGINYGLLIEIMDLARLAGIEKLSLATILKK